MNRRSFLGLLGLIGCNEEDMLTVAKKQFFLNTSNSIADAFTNAQGEQGILIVADSTGGFATDDVYGPTPTAGTVKEYKQSDNTIINVGATDLIDTGTGGTFKGSMWPKFGIDYNAGSSRIPVFVDCHYFDSNLLWATDATNKWLYDSTNYFKGDNYDLMKIKADAALVKIGVTKYKAIFVMLSVNDIGDNLFTASVLNGAYNKLIEYLQTDYPGSPIYLVLPSNISTADTPTALQADVRWHIMETVPATYSGVEVVYSALHAISQDLQVGAHWSSVMNNYMGSSFARYILDTETDADVKRIVNQYPTAINATKKAAWKTFITNVKASGAWDLLNYLKFHVADVAQNEPYECIGITAPYRTNSVYTFQANTGILTDNGGATKNWNSWYFPTLHTKRGGAEDIMAFAKIGTNVTLTDYAATLFGSGTSGLLVGKTAPGLVRYKANDASNTDFLSGDVAPRLLNNTWYGAVRRGATKIIYKNSTNFNSVGGLPAGALNGGTMKIGVTMNSGHEAFFVAQDTGFPIASFLTECDTLIAALKIA